MKERMIICNYRKGEWRDGFISILKPDEIAYWKTLNLIDQ